jgi:hypothetical protein
MHQPIARHGFSPDAHWHAWPGVLQVEPARPVQSALVQQAPAEMHAPRPGHSRSPAGHSQEAPGWGHTCPVCSVVEQSALVQQLSSGIQPALALHMRSPGGQAGAGGPASGAPPST